MAGEMPFACCAKLYRTDMTLPDPSMPDTAARSRAHRRWLRWLPLAILVLGTILFFAFGLNRYVSYTKLRMYHHDLADFVALHYVKALLLYAGIYLLFVAFSLPGAVWLTVIGGFLFGIVPAVIVTVLAATAGACVLFLATKSSLGEYLRAHAGPWLTKVERGFAEDQWSYMLVLRLVPVVPFFIANLIPAFLGVSLHIFAITTFIGIIPATAIFATVGDGLDSVLKHNEMLSWHGLFTLEIKLALFGLALLAALPVLVKHWRRRHGGNS
jgi:uncharacterized membrane protein YdjX (TVP38/TMEM64 family)